MLDRGKIVTVSILGVAVLLGLYALFTSVNGLLQHTNADLMHGWFNRIFATADLHRWHHHPVMEIGSLYAEADTHPVGMTAANDYRMDPAAIDADVLAKAAIVWLNYPHNPTGQDLPDDLWEAWVEAQREHGFVLCSDECYTELYFGEKPRSLLEFAVEVSAKIAKACTLEDAPKHADLMWREQYSIHYHVWDQQAFKAFLDFLPGFLESYSLEVIDHAPTQGDEFVYVMERRQAS